MNAIKFAKLQKKYTQNLTRCELFNSESDACSKGWFKIWLVVKKLTGNLTRRKNVHSFKIWQDEKILFENHAFHKNFLFKIMLFSKSFLFKIMLFRKFFYSKSCFLKLHVKHKICAFYGVKRIKTQFFVCKFFFSKSAFQEYFFLHNLAF